jgi:transcriptional regulator ttgR
MRRTKAEAEQTRNDILKAALILFDEQGYAQTSLSNIAQSKSHPRRHLLAF